MRTYEWVSLLPGHLSLSKFSWPGTHDSCARHWGPAVECQKWTITEQLRNGIRFLDIRACYSDDHFSIFHGTFFQHITFRDVRDECLKFLKANPGEVVIMSLDEENSKAGWEKFEKVLMKQIHENDDLWYISERIPTLDEVRGKIVLIRRWGEKGTFGIPWAACDVQDDYNLTKKSGTPILNPITGAVQVKIINSLDSDRKWGEMSSLFQVARNNENSDKLFINFGSGYWFATYPGIDPIISDVKNIINPKIKNYMRECITDNRSNFGCIIPMDFPDQKEIDAIIFQTYHRHGLLKRCRVYSHYRKEYLFAWKRSDVSDNRRSVFTWVGGKYDEDMVWWLIGSKIDGLFWLHCENEKEYLFASGQTQDIDRRKVFTWAKGIDDGNAGWTIETAYNSKCKIGDAANVFDNITLKNTDFGEYLYAASDSFIRDGDHRKVFCWIKNKELPAEGKWRIEFI